MREFWKLAVRVGIRVRVSARAVGSRLTSKLKVKVKLGKPVVAHCVTMAKVLAADVTMLCQFHCGVAEVCAEMSVILCQCPRRIVTDLRLVLFCDGTL